MFSLQGETLQATLQGERGSAELKNIMLEGNKITCTVERGTPPNRTWHVRGHLTTVRSTGTRMAGT